MKLLIVLALVAAAYGGVAKIGVSHTAVLTKLSYRYDLLEWYKGGDRYADYDCSGHQDGNYPHPTKCTHYIACVAQAYAYEMPCADNHDGNLLHYVQDSGPDPARSKCDYPDVVQCSRPPNPEPTTEAPGKECNPLDCWNEGYCRDFNVCHNGQASSGQCEDNLWWNPHNWVEGHVTGQCDHWENLSDEVKSQYEHDENCIPPCAWWGVGGACTQNYIFRAPFSGDVHDRETSLTCSAGLVWAQDQHNCVHCSSRQNEDGGDCCGVTMIR